MTSELVDRLRPPLRTWLATVRDDVRRHSLGLLVVVAAFLTALAGALLVQRTMVWYSIHGEFGTVYWASLFMWIPGVNETAWEMAGRQAKVAILPALFVAATVAAVIDRAQLVARGPGRGFRRSALRWLAGGVLVVATLFLTWVGTYLLVFPGVATGSRPSLLLVPARSIVLGLPSWAIMSAPAVAAGIGLAIAVGLTLLVRAGAVTPAGIEQLFLPVLAGAVVLGVVLWPAYLVLQIAWSGAIVLGLGIARALAPRLVPRTAGTNSSASATAADG